MTPYFIYDELVKGEIDQILTDGLPLSPEQYNPEYLAAVIEELRTQYMNLLDEIKTLS